MQQLLLFSLITLISGFASFCAVVAMPLSWTHTTPIEWKRNFGPGKVVYPDSLGNGWRSKLDAYAMAERAELRVKLPLPSTHEAVEVQLRIVPEASATIAVAIDSKRIALWKFKAGKDVIFRRFVADADIVGVKRNFKIELTRVDHKGRPTTSRMPLRLVYASVRSASKLKDMQGFVSSCDRNKIRGWAVADDIALPVLIRVNGQVVTRRPPQQLRRDLAKRGLPTDAGFQYNFDPPLATGSSVTVHYPNGRALNGKPCRI